MSSVAIGAQTKVTLVKEKMALVAACSSDDKPALPPLASHYQDEELSWLAKKVPKVKLTKDPKENNTLIMQRYALMNAITWLQKNPDRVMDTWMMIAALDQQKQVKRPESLEWNSEYRHIWRLPDYWKAQFLQSRLPQIFTDSYIKTLENAGEGLIKRLFALETGLDDNDPLPRLCLNKLICARTILQRAKECGNRLSSLSAESYPPLQHRQ